MRHQVPLKYGYNFLRGFLEQELGLLRLIVRPGDRVIDVGANRGIYAYKLSQLGARVEAFEPNPTCFAVLSAWARGRRGVTLHQIALSDRSGSATLHIPIDASGVEHDASASIEATGFEDARDQPVAVATLDSFGFDDVVFVKIDVEGHEHSVIEGACCTLESARPALLVEIEQRHNGRPVTEMFDEIRAYGYRGYFMKDGALVRIEEFDQSVHQSGSAGRSRRGQYINNFLFLSEEKIAAGRYALLPGIGA